MPILGGCPIGWRSSVQGGETATVKGPWCPEYKEGFRLGVLAYGCKYKHETR